MRRFLPAVVFLVIIIAFGTWALRGAGLFGGLDPAEVREVPAGHQEVAWIAPATSTDAWERLVAAVRQTEQNWSRLPGAAPLRVSYDNAFLEVTAGVPELGVHLAGNESAKLWIRWYKVSSQTDAREWVARLARRSVPPLAIIGGDTTDRALSLAKALSEQQRNWSGEPPLLLITTATADRYSPEDASTTDLTQDRLPKLMDVYEGRSFRFSFTNSRMAEAVLDFIEDHPEVWPQSRNDAPALAGLIAAGSPWALLAGVLETSLYQPPYLYTLAWSDDRYSLDLADRFGKLFREAFHPGSERWAYFYNNYVHYGIGDFQSPNPSEAIAVGIFLALNPNFRDRNHLLALPTGAQRARRILRTLCRRAPQEVRNLVVISGDSINFNNVYRDRDLVWNAEDMPVPLVFFSHRNPIDPEAGFEPGPSVDGRAASTGTQDLLLQRDIVDALFQGVFHSGTLSGGSGALWTQLRQTGWQNGRVLNAAYAQAGQRSVPLFDAEGNRNRRTGEHVLWLKPQVADGRVFPQATLSVWSLGPEGEGRDWRLFGRPLTLLYDRPQTKDPPRDAVD